MKVNWSRRPLGSVSFKWSSAIPDEDMTSYLLLRFSVFLNTPFFINDFGQNRKNRAGQVGIGMANFLSFTKNDMQMRHNHRDVAIHGVFIVLFLTSLLHLDGRRIGETD